MRFRMSGSWLCQRDEQRANGEVAYLERHLQYPSTPGLEVRLHRLSGLVSSLKVSTWTPVLAHNFLPPHRQGSGWILISYSP
jgi:hypothetical protein